MFNIWNIPLTFLMLFKIADGMIGESNPLEEEGDA